MSRCIGTPSTLCQVTGASREDVVAVVEAFRAPGISFVMPPANVPLDDGTVVDISHESLMRVWIRLSEWVDEESRSARIYRRIADAAELHERGAGALLIDPALSIDLAWRTALAPTAAWAERYVPDSYERTMRFLDRSSEQRDRDIAAAGVARRRRAFTATGFVVAFLFTLLSIGALLVLQHQRGEVLAAQSRNLARDAQSAIDRGDIVTGGLIALAALPQSLSKPDRPFTREALDALTRAYTELREKRDLTGHTGPIFRIAMSPDGRRVAAASEDGTARIWAVPSGELLHVIHGPGDLMSAINWSPDGRQLVATFKDGTARSYDGTTYEKLVLFRHDSGYIFSGVFSRNGRYLLTASSDGQTRIWNAATGTVLRVLQGKGDTGMWCATFSPDGSKIATASADGYVRIWDARTAKQLHVFAYSGPAYWVDFAPDGRRIVAALGDSTVRVLDASSGKQLLVIHDGDITTYSATFSHDGRRIALGLRKKNAEVVDARTGKLLINLIGSDGHLWATAFSPDDRLLATGSGDGIARLWDLRERQPILTLIPPRTGENNVATYFGDGRRIAVAGDLDVARIWDAATGKVIRTLRGSGRGYRRAAVSTDGKLVATSGLSGIGIWDADSGRLLRHIVRSPLAREGPIAFMPDGRRILTGSSEDGFVRMWDWPSATLLKTFAENMTSVTALAVSHDGRSIAAGGFGETVYVWDATSGRLRHKLELHDSVIQDLSFSLDDTRLLSSPDDGELDEWDTQTGNVLAILNAHTNVNTNAAAYSPDGSRIVAAMDDGSIRVLDALDGDPLLILRADDASLNSASFSPDGHNVVAASEDGMVRVWRLPTVPTCQHLIDVMRDTLPRPLRPDQLAEESISLDRASPLTNLFMGGETCSP